MNLRMTKHRGVSMLYAIIVIGALFMFASLAVDVARVQVAKTELRRTADAAARYAAMGIPSGISTVRARAKDAADDNAADGNTVTIGNSDIEFGTWDAAARTFTVLSGAARSDANAVRVTASRKAANGTAVPLTFARVFGKTSCDVTASATAMYVASEVITFNVPATSCPWLAGAAGGTVANLGNPHNNPDYAPQACPKLMPSAMALTPGQSLQFNSINGGANNLSSSINFTPDGNPNDVQDNWNGTENGLAGMICPLNSVVGVFLDAAVPAGSGIPPTLDFSTDAKRNFTELSPMLRQPFFIGDGLMNDGTTKQSFKVPQGATRLFIGTMDGWEWNNNQGSFTTTVTKPEQVMLVK